MKSKNLSDFNEFKIRAYKAHNKSFNYINYDWENRKVSFEIDGIIYTQIIYEHVKGSLPKDYKLKLYYDNFLIEANKIHNNSYEYSNYINSNTPLTITCKSTGKVYQQRIKDILSGCRPKESIKKYTFELFKKECEIIHDNKFSYEDYTSINKPVTIIHNKTGKKYSRLAYNHLKSSVPKELALKNVSQMELDILKELNHLYPELEIITNFRPKWLNQKELDLYIPDLKIAIELNGTLYYHSSKEVPRKGLYKFRKDIMYHTNKTKLCLENGIKLIHIFDFQLKTLDLKSTIDKYISSDISIINNSNIYVNNRTLEVSSTKKTEEYLIVYYPEIDFTANCKA